MYNCEICPASFTNSDEFEAHQGKHLRDFDKLDQYLGYPGSQKPTDSAGKTAQLAADKLIRIIESRFPRPSAYAGPPPPRYSFEVVQLAIVALNAGKTPQEVINVCEEIRQALEKPSAASPQG